MAIKILLVDDDKEERDAVDMILKSNGYLVVKAADSENALSFLATETFDLVLLDMTLPDRSGFRVLEFLRASNAASKVIVLTGTAGLKDASNGTASGAMRYDAKPNFPVHLMKSIELVLSDRAPLKLKLQIVKAGDFIKSTPTGTLDMAGSKEGLAHIAATGATLHDYTVLIDLRDVRSKLSTTDIYEIASQLSTYGDTFRRKTAMLVRDDDDFDQAAFFEDVAQNNGFLVRMFTAFEDAVGWLSVISEPVLSGSARMPV